jgi:hypothetical protein
LGGVSVVPVRPIREPFLNERCSQKCKDLFYGSASAAPGTLAVAGNLFGERNHQAARSMMENHAKDKDHPERIVNRPVVVAVAVAIFGVLAMLIVDHGPWNRPQVQTAEVTNHKTTGQAARAVGATVTPTEPKPAIEPVAPGPKPVHPANSAPGAEPP